MTQCPKPKSIPDLHGAHKKYDINNTQKV